METTTRTYYFATYAVSLSCLGEYVIWNDNTRIDAGHVPANVTPAEICRNARTDNAIVREELKVVADYIVMADYIVVADYIEAQTVNA